MSSKPAAGASATLKMLGLTKGRGDSRPAVGLAKAQFKRLRSTGAWSDRRQLTVGRAIRCSRRPRLGSLAQAALELPTVGRGSDGNDVEIEAFVPLVRIFVRNERDLAQDGPVGVVVALGGQHLQILSCNLLPAAASRS